MSRQRYWTDDEDAALKQLWGLKTSREIAAAIGRTKGSVIGRADRLKLPQLKLPTRVIPEVRQPYLWELTTWEYKAKNHWL